MLTRLRDSETVTCLDLHGGKVIWRDQYAAEVTVFAPAKEHGKGPKSTPVVHAGKLYTLGVSGTLSCYDARGGKLIWRRESAGNKLGESYPIFGMTPSPLVAGGNVIVPVGGNNHAQWTAFDLHTGAVRWQWGDPDIPKDGNGMGYSSPVEIQAGGERHVIILTPKDLVGLRSSDGKLLWRHGLAGGEATVTPVSTAGLIVISRAGKAVAVRVTRRDGGWATEDVWQNPALHSAYSSPVPGGQFIFGLSGRNKGQLFCADARSGVVVWSTEGREGEYASLVRAGSMLLILNTDGLLTVAAAGAKGFTPARRYRVADSPTWAHPVVVGAGILVKDKTDLTLWGA